MESVRKKIKFSELSPLEKIVKKTCLILFAVDSIEWNVVDIFSMIFHFSFHGQVACWLLKK